MSHADAIPLPANDAAIACLHGARTGDLSLGNSHDEWSPQLELPRSLWEIFSSADDAAGEALALAFARTHRRHIDQDGIDQDGAWLWVQDASSIRRGGRPYLHGLPAEQRSNLIHVAARNAADALWAMEEGVRCGALSFVIGEIAGDPKALDFTASRRLVLAAERHGVPLYLVRREGYANLSAARLRWRAGSGHGAFALAARLPASGFGLRPSRIAARLPLGLAHVSYTDLTLPTILRV